MRTKLRYVLLLGSAILLCCFIYLHSKLKNEDDFTGRKDADLARKRNDFGARDHNNNHIFQKAGWEDQYNPDNFFKERDKGPEKLTQDGGDEDSNASTLDQNEQVEVGAKDADILPRPDVQHVDVANFQKGVIQHEVGEDRRQGAYAGEKSNSNKSNDGKVLYSNEKKRKKVVAAPGAKVDPVANFHWNQKERNMGQQIQNWVPKASSGKCTPRTNITFLKVHKTGSSTVQNIFLRYGDLHSLKFVLPIMGHHLGYPGFFERKHMLKVQDGVYNIFCHHTRFSNEVREIMPPNTVYISILRDPVKVFESSFTYFKLDWRMKMAGDKNAMSTFMSNPSKYYAEFPNKIHSRNGMLFDFGVPDTEYDNTVFINRAISTINDQFGLVMIAEHFEESLILMKDLLCWTLDEVVVFSQNARNSDSVQQVDPELRAKIQSWNFGDVLLYDFFNRTLWEKIDRYGRERMERDKMELKRRTDSLYNRCVASDSAPREQGDFKVWQPPGVNINAFILKPEAKGNKLCESMVKPEIQYTMELKQKQFPDIDFTQRKRKMKGPFKQRN